MPAGRPHEQGLGYFSHPVDYYDNDLIKDIRKLHGGEGLVFWQIICGALFKNSYFLPWNERTVEDLLRYRYSEEQMQTYVKSFIDIGLIDRGIFEQYKVITSEELQGMYLNSTLRRDKVIFIKEYTLFDFRSRETIRQPIYLYNLKGNQPIGVFNLKGSLIDRFQIREHNYVDFDFNPGKKNHPKHKIVKEAMIDKPAAEPEPAQPSPEREPENPAPISNVYTVADVAKDILIPYEKRDDIFRETYSKEEYASFTALCRKVDTNYRYLKKSAYQLRLADYIEATETMSASPAEIETAFGLMKELVITRDTVIYDELIQYLPLVRSAEKKVSSGQSVPTAVGSSEEKNQEPRARNQERTVDSKETDPSVKAPYVKDKALEQAVCDFFGINEIKTYKNWVLVHQFCEVMHETNQLAWFKTQFGHYKQYINLVGLRYRNSFKNFIGKQEDRFTGGEWCSQIWEEKLESVQEQQKKQDKKVLVKTESKAELAVSSHKNFMDKIRAP